MNSAQVSVLLIGLLFITGAYAPGSARDVMLTNAQLTAHLTQAWNLYRTFVNAGETQAAAAVVDASEFRFSSGVGIIEVIATSCHVDARNKFVSCELPKNQLLPASSTAAIDHAFLTNAAFQDPAFTGAKVAVPNFAQNSEILTYTQLPHYRFAFKFYEKPGVLQSVLEKLQVLKFVRRLLE